MGIACPDCGFDNFPFTNGDIGGSYASGKLVKLTKFCHQCGAALFFECPICGNLHPTGSVFCSVAGTKIEDFQEMRKITPEDVSEFTARKDVLAIAGEVPPMVNKIFRWGSSICILLALLSMSFSWNVPSMIFLPAVALLVGVVVMLSLMMSFASFRSAQIQNIWFKEKRIHVQFLVNRFGQIKVES